jgi:hypothetical protein
MHLMQVNFLTCFLASLTCKWGGKLYELFEDVCWLEVDRKIPSRVQHIFNPITGQLHLLDGSTLLCAAPTMP